MSEIAFLISYDAIAEYRYFAPLYVVDQQLCLASADIFLTTIFLGSCAIASSSTIIAAIIAKANTRGTLYPVLSFPIMLPMLMTVIKATQLSLEGAFFAEALGEFQILIWYTVVVVAVSVILFEFVWKD